MRPQAVAPMEPTRGGGEGLTQALARSRRGTVPLRDENAELRAALSHLHQRRSAAPR
jgi:hypothetical protein